MDHQAFFFFFFFFFCKGRRVTEEQQKEVCKVFTFIDQQGSNEPKNPLTSTVAKPQAVSPAPLMETRCL